MSGEDGYVPVAVFAGGEVLVAQNKLVVLGHPVDETDETSPRFHNCDQMGCGRAHVIFRGLLATRCGYCGLPFADAMPAAARRGHVTTCPMNPLVQELADLRSKQLVGELLARTRRGTIVEYNAEHDGALFRQTRLLAGPGLAGMESRYWTQGAWHPWRGLSPGVDAVDLRRTGRVVAAADANDNPYVRGPMPRDDGGDA